MAQPGIFFKEELRFPADALRIQGQKLPILHHQGAVDDGVAHIGAGGTLHQGVHQVLGGPQVGRVDVYSNEVC